MRTLLLVVILLSANSVFADTFRQDSSGNVTCEQDMESKAEMTFGVRHGDDDYDRYDPYGHNSGDSTGSEIYAEVRIPLGRQPERINCNRFAKIAEQQKEMELAQDKLEHEAQVTALQAEIHRLKGAKRSFTLEERSQK